MTTTVTTHRHQSTHWYGVHIGLVTDLRDPTGLGRVKVRLPWSPDPGGGTYEAWARLATMMGGNNRGSWFVPDKDDEVLLAFEGGDPRSPFVVGSLWNGKDKPPEAMDGAGKNAKKVLRSRNGVKVTLDDTAGKERFVVETPGGQRITLSDGPGAVEVVDSTGNSVKLETTGMTLTAVSTVTVKAPKVNISAATVTVDAGMSKFSGVVKADTVMASAIVSSSYTPGAGNIW